MNTNRRNYYRILHVQPEAPTEIIRASYRTLMGPLGQHPDKGGNHLAAALINEAYAVLGDPVRRAAYDRTIPNRAGRRDGRADGRRDGATGPGKPAPAPAPQTDPAHWQLQRRCPFCRATLAGAPPRLPRCARCDAPLTPMPKPDAQRKELLGARTSTRMAKNHAAVLFGEPGGPPVPVRMRDLSLTGASMVSASGFAARQAVRIVDGDIEAVGVVIACRRRAAAHIVHVQWLTISMGRRTGVFVSEHA